MDILTPVVAVSTGAGDDSVRGELGRSMAAQVALGDGTDVAMLSGLATVRGGAGPDRITVATTGRTPSTLDGGTGDDVLAGDGMLIGGAGDDRLRGGPRNDALRPGPGRDRVSGGDGRDLLVYGGSAPVGVDLRRRTASTRAGTARLRSVENALTAAGNDVLVGDAGANVLDGGPGRNVIRAGGGDDTLASPGPGSACGSGRDTVRVPTNGDLVPDYREPPPTTYPPTAAPLTRPLPPDCERIALPGYRPIRAQPGVSAREVRFTLARPAAGRDVWELRAGWRARGALLGKTTVRRTDEHVVIALNARGRACVATGSCRAALTVRDPDGFEEDASSPLPLVLQIT
jgi:hypothetical protein